MAKLSLLDMVQNILSAMDSDPVNSIDDTVESVQVATIVRETFEEMMASRDWPFLRRESALVGLADLNNPTKMLMPEGLNKIFWLKYKKTDVEYVEPKIFRDMLDSRIPEAGKVDSKGIVLTRDPLYWTSFDDANVVFDSIDKTSESTLQTSNNVVYGVIVPAWTHTDSFIPAIPEKVFPTLLAEAKATCFINLKQQQNNKEEIKARRGRVRLQNEAWRNDQAETRYNNKVNYGRK